MRTPAETNKPTTTNHCGASKCRAPHGPFTAAIACSEVKRRERGGASVAINKFIDANRLSAMALAFAAASAFAFALTLAVPPAAAFDDRVGSNADARICADFVRPAPNQLNPEHEAALQRLEALT